MTKKGFIISLCTIAVLLGATYLWSNILILDDYHPTFEEIQPTPCVTPQQDNTQNNKATSPTPQPNTEPQRPSNPTPPKGYHIHINLDAFTAYVYKDGQLIKTYPVSGGKASTPSPLGTWRIISKDTWGEGFGGAWMGFNVPWGKYGIHGTVYPWFIGKSNSSKGCIRMKNKDVKELYKIVPHGTTVTIVHNNPVFRTLKSGDVGSDVKEVQKALKNAGYYRGGADGRFGTGLKYSIQKFQKDNKLTASGIVNRQTYNLLMQKQKPAEAKPQPTPGT
ncbi:MAG: L,D-transpeptidase family protein [Clostridia bacterium]|nr:L,D-transpeptidase family protein [Clostridia bacterium]